MARLHKIKLLLADREFNFILVRYLLEALMKYSVWGMKKMNSYLVTEVKVLMQFLNLTSVILLSQMNQVTPEKESEKG